MVAQVRPQEALLRQARRIFLDQSELPPGLINERLARSWQRSRNAGLSPVGRFQDVPRLAEPALRQNLEGHRDFLAHARPVMEHLFAQVRDSQSMVILADRSGLLVHALGDPDFLSKAERVALTPGAFWQEQYRGTNAIGTALVEGVPVEIRGAEHFLERNGFLTCTAAPIFDPSGQVLGVLDISSDQRNHHPHTRGLVRTAAQMIENRLLLSRHGRSLRLHLHHQQEGIGTFAEGILAVSEDGWLIGANQAALAQLGLGPGDLGATPLQRIFDIRPGELLAWGRRHPGQALRVGLHRGGQLFVQFQGDAAPIPVAAEPRTSLARPVPGDALSPLDTGDAQLAAAIAKARRVLDKPIPLVLHGESGVGKELFAQAIHAASARKDQPFVAVNCAALPEPLIEAELFGYAPGAFTGARKEGSLGRLREAHGGTLFLDEIGDMPLGLQSRLLRVLQERQVTPLGEGRPVPVDFALICATHRQLREESEAGRFRADLYYRLNGLTLNLPPLRQRSDLDRVVARMLAELAPGQGLELHPEVAAAFAAYHWPGNLRQLANGLRTAVALLDGGEAWIGWEHLPDDLVEELRQEREEAVAAPVATLATSLADLSRAAIDRVLAQERGNVSAAARRLGISRNTLYRKLRRD